MTAEERRGLTLAADALDLQVESLRGNFPTQRELALALTRLEEAAMWLRRSIERS